MEKTAHTPGPWTYITKDGVGARTSTCRTWRCLGPSRCRRAVVAPDECPSAFVAAARMTAEDIDASAGPASAIGRLIDAALAMRAALVTVTNVGSGEARRIALEALRAIDD